MSIGWKFVLFNIGRLVWQAAEWTAMLSCMVCDNLVIVWQMLADEMLQRLCLSIIIAVFFNLHPIVFLLKSNGIVISVLI